MKEFPLFISNRLMTKLSLIDHQISDDLKALRNDYNGRFTQTFIDIDEEDSNCITFIQSNKAIQLLGATETSFGGWAFRELCEYAGQESDVYTKYRSKIKWGRFLNINFPDKYELSKKGSQNNTDIESFVNQYKALCDRDTKFALMDIVSGDKIGYWYNYRRYFNNNYGTLSSSCMKSVTTNYYNIYMKNPEKVSLIIMYSDETKTKIKARSILWKLDEPDGRFFMDRVYTNDYSDEQIFIDFAKKNNWLYKSSQSMGADIELIDPIGNNCPETISIMVKLNGIRYRKFPYMDTMTNLNKKGAIVSNSMKFSPDRRLYYTDGGYETLNVVHSNLYGYAINRREAVYCELGSDWVYSRDTVKVYNAGDRLAVVGYEGIVEQVLVVNGDTKRKWFEKEKCVWSEYLKTWIYHESVVTVNLNMDRTETYIDHKRHKDELFFEINGEFWAKHLVNERTKTLKSEKKN